MYMEENRKPKERDCNKKCCSYKLWPLLHHFRCCFVPRKIFLFAMTRTAAVIRYLLLTTRPTHKLIDLDDIQATSTLFHVYLARPSDILLVLIHGKILSIPIIIWASTKKLYGQRGHRRSWVGLTLLVDMKAHTLEQLFSHNSNSWKKRLQCSFV